jgi:SNF2 family DNA or RNA helicase
MTDNFIADIQHRIDAFNALLDRSGLDKKKYQEDGVRWCLTNELRPNPPANIRGGFIADEMGLGKTILMIGTFVANMMTKTLIILPPVLVEQWAQQIRKLTGHNPIIFHGKNKKTITLETLQKSIIVLSTYNTISVTDKQLKAKKISLLHEVKWNRIVFDEGHHLRNKNTARLNGTILLKSKIRWIVSGTPIQNKISDLYNLCKALKMPHSFYSNSDNLIVIAKNFVLKRTKHQAGILLPSVTVSTETVEWKSDKEKELSEGIHAVLQMVSQDKMDAIGELISNQPGSVLRAILRARQSCILPKMMEKMFADFVKDGSINNYDEYKDGLSFSSKLDTVVDTILKNKGNGCGKLVFCHFREEIDELKRKLQLGGIVKIATFDGRLNQSFRQAMLDDNNEVLLLQIQTGCEGLNLQENYSEIYFVSPHWNPSVEDQAIARCHRIGQVKEVKVYRFNMGNFTEERNEQGQLTEKTIETYVSKVQDDKRTVASSFMGQ